MARGIDTDELIPYVLEDDRELPEKEQTVFHIRQYGALSTAKMERELERSQRLMQNGMVDVDVNKRQRFYSSTFAEIVDHIDNFFFHGEEKGIDIAEDDVHGKRRVLEQMRPAWMTEILEVAQKGGGLSTAEKKPSKSRRTTPSGGRTT